MVINKKTKEELKFSYNGKIQNFELFENGELIYKHLGTKESFLRALNDLGITKVRIKGKW